MNFKLTINMDNAAFGVTPEKELSRIISKILNLIEGGATYGSCYACNGNKVGTWEIEA